MPSASLEPVAEEVKRLVDAALAQLDADTDRLHRAFRAIPADDADGLSLAVFKALLAARRNVLATYGRLLTLDSSHSSKNFALAWCSVVAAAIAAFHRELHATSSAERRRQQRLATEYFARGHDALLKLDRELGCPYGCKERT
jgi:hypothetical protein